MLILWRLLLKPLLDFMDARSARIARARSLDRSAEREAQRARLQAEREAALCSRAEERRKAALALREAGQRELAAQAADFRQESQDRRQELEAEAARLVPELATSLQAHVDAFTDKLMAFGDR